jgi:hypothetical protein
VNNIEKKMLEILKAARDYGVVAVKAEFEAEGTRSDEFLRLLEIARRADLKVALKIGGCEAIRDLIEARNFGVDYIIAPMIETPYALTKYVAAKDKIYPADEQGDVSFLFNVETRTGFENLAGMSVEAEKGNTGFVFGRVDFAGSLGKGREIVNADETMDCVEKVAEEAAARNLELVVGGGVNPDSIAPLRRIRKIRLDRFETRKVIFDGACLEGGDVEKGMEHAIDFELLWLKNKRDFYRSIAAEDEKRIGMMEARQQSSFQPVG